MLAAVATNLTKLVEDAAFLASGSIFIAQATPPTPEPAPAPANVVIRRSVEIPATWNYDLGCTGFTDTNVAISLVRDGKYFDDYQNHSGWCASGDARYSHTLADKIFPSVAGNNYLDKSPGCFANYLKRGTRETIKWITWGAENHHWLERRWELSSR